MRSRREVGRHARGRVPFSNKPSSSTSLLRRRIVSAHARARVADRGRAARKRTTMDMRSAALARAASRPPARGRARRRAFATTGRWPTHSAPRRPPGPGTDLRRRRQRRRAHWRQPQPQPRAPRPAAPRAARSAAPGSPCAPRHRPAGKLGRREEVSAAAQHKSLGRSKDARARRGRWVYSSCIEVGPARAPASSCARSSSSSRLRARLASSASGRSSSSASLRDGIAKS